MNNPVNKILSVIVLLFIQQIGMASPIEPIRVTEQTIKLLGKKEFYFAFAKGDKVIIDLEVVKGKTIKEFIFEPYQSSSIFNDIKVSKITNKSIDLQKQDIYKITIKGGLSFPEIVKLKIQRIPESLDYKDFDTNVNWVEKVDTTYRVYTKNVIVGYDTSYVTKYNHILIKVDTSFSMQSRLERVHSKTNLSHSNTTSFDVQLPQNKSEYLKTTEVISWSYKIQTGDRRSIRDNVQNFSIGLINTKSKAGLMAGLALGTVSSLATPPKGDNVNYGLSLYYRNQWVSLGEGNSIMVANRVYNHTQGMIRFYLGNDNLINGINVSVEILAVIVEKTYRAEPYQQRVVKSLKGNRTFKDPIYKKRKVPEMRG
jgi:ribosomal protein S17E